MDPLDVSHGVLRRWRAGVRGRIDPSIDTGPWCSTMVLPCLAQCSQAMGCTISSCIGRHLLPFWLGSQVWMYTIVVISWERCALDFSAALQQLLVPPYPLCIILCGQSCILHHWPYITLTFIATLQDRSAWHGVAAACFPH